MLAPIAREVRIIELPAAVPIKGDVSSLIDAGWTRERIAKLIERAPKYEASQARPPIVEDSEQFQIVAAQAFEALRCNNSPVRVVKFAGGLARVEEKETGESHVVELEVYRLRDELTLAADWYDTKFRPDVPSVDFGRMLLAKAAKAPSPAVTRFARSPVYTQDARLLVAPGHDKGSGIFLLPTRSNFPIFPRSRAPTS